MVAAPAAGALVSTLVSAAPIRSVVSLTKGDTLFAQVPDAVDRAWPRGHREPADRSTGEGRKADEQHRGLNTGCEGGSGQACCPCNTCQTGEQDQKS